MGELTSRISPVCQILCSLFLSFSLSSSLVSLSNPPTACDLRGGLGSTLCSAGVGAVSGLSLGGSSNSCSPPSEMLGSVALLYTLYGKRPGGNNCTPDALTPVLVLGVCLPDPGGGGVFALLDLSFAMLTCILTGYWYTQAL